MKDTRRRRNSQRPRLMVCRPRVGKLQICKQWNRCIIKIIGVLFGCFGRTIDGDSWFTWWFNHPGPSISPKRTPIIKSPVLPANGFHMTLSPGYPPSTRMGTGGTGRFDWSTRIVKTPGWTLHTTVFCSVRMCSFFGRTFRTSALACQGGAPSQAPSLADRFSRLAPRGHSKRSR